MGGRVDLDARPDHNMVANMHLITVENGTQDIQKDVIANMNVLTVHTVEGRLNERILTNMS